MQIQRIKRGVLRRLPDPVADTAQAAAAAWRDRAKPRIPGLDVPGSSFVGEPRRVTNPASIYLGQRVLIRPGARLEVVPVTPGAEPTGRLNIGDGTQLEDMVTISAAGTLYIGRNCLISSFVTITDNDHSRGGPDVERNVYGDARVLDQPQVVEETRIGNNVWIGTGAVILKGVIVGDAATIGANAVVTRAVPAGATVGGVPAKVLSSGG